MPAWACRSWAGSRPSTAQRPTSSTTSTRTTRSSHARTARASSRGSTDASKTIESSAGRRSRSANSRSSLGRSADARSQAGGPPVGRLAAPGDALKAIAAERSPDGQNGPASPERIAAATYEVAAARLNGYRAALAAAGVERRRCRYWSARSTTNGKRGPDVASPAARRRRPAERHSCDERPISTWCRRGGPRGRPRLTSGSPSACATSKTLLAERGVAVSISWKGTLAQVLHVAAVRCRPCCHPRPKGGTNRACQGRLVGGFRYLPLAPHPPLTAWNLGTMRPAQLRICICPHGEQPGPGISAARRHRHRRIVGPDMAESRR